MLTPIDMKEWEKTCREKTGLGFETFKTVTHCDAETLDALLEAASGSKGRPMLPPTCTLYPAALSSSEIMVVVVVLPSLPVTAMILQGQTRKKTSISEVISAPRSRAASNAGTSGRRPGVRKITS